MTTNRSHLEMYMTILQIEWQNEYKRLYSKLNIHKGLFWGTFCHFMPRIYLRIFLTWHHLVELLSSLEHKIPKDGDNSTHLFCVRLVQFKGNTWFLILAENRSINNIKYFWCAHHVSDCALHRLHFMFITTLWRKCYHHLQILDKKTQ